MKKTIKVSSTVILCTALPAIASENTTLTTIVVEEKTPSRYAPTISSSSTRTASPIKETPQSINIIPEALIKDQQNLTVSESLENASSIQANSVLSTPAFDSTLARGFKAEQRLDGFTQYYNSGDRESLVGVDQIEVLKGSNGVLYSGGIGAATGGIINLISKRPHDEQQVTLGIKAGSDDLTQPYFDLNQPLTQGINFRINGEYTDSTMEIGDVDTERYNINPSISVETEDKKQRLTLLGKISKWKQQEYQGLPATGTIAGDFKIDPNLFIGAENTPDSESKYTGLTAIYESQLNENWSLEASARRSSSSFDEKVQALVGGDGFIADTPFFGVSTWALFDAELYQEQEETSLVLNITGELDAGGMTHTLLLGADYSRFEDEGYINSNAGSGFVDLSAPLFPNYLIPGPGINNLIMDTKTYGIYAQLQTDITDSIHLLSALRWAAIDGSYQDTSLNTLEETDKKRLLPRLGIVVDLDDNFSWFASYSEGMQAQPFLNFVGEAQPELSEQIETGIKFNLAEGLSGQAAVYKIDRTNVAVTDFTDPLFRSVAEGKQRSQGVELDLVWALTGSTQILANYAYTDTEFRDELFGVDKGNRLPGVPAHSGKIWLNHLFSNNWSGGLGVYAQSSSYLSNNNQYELDGYHRFDASLSFKHRDLKLGLSMKNLTNKSYFERYNYFGGRVAPALDRSYYLTAEVDF